MLRNCDRIEFVVFQIGKSYDPEAAREMLAKDGALMERVSFRHCTADATLKMVQVEIGTSRNFMD